VAKFHETTPPGSKILAANTQHFKPIFDLLLKKNCKGVPILVGGALVRLGHFLAGVIIWWRSPLGGRNMTFRKSGFGWVNISRVISGAGGLNFTKFLSLNTGLTVLHNAVYRLSISSSSLYVVG